MVPASVALSVVAGYAFATMRFRGSQLIFWLFILGLIIPTEATIVPLYYDVRAMGLLSPTASSWCSSGPSGCGKTTALRMLAGLEEITEGEIRSATRGQRRRAADRDIAMVFQNYALYPHMTVATTSAFGLRLRKVPKDEIDRG
jgi:hypothetical protein